jgi:putative hydrolase of the HAD superfamily
MKTLLVDAIHTTIMKLDDSWFGVNLVKENLEINKALVNFLASLWCRKIVITNAPISLMMDVYNWYHWFDFFSCYNNPNKTDPNYFYELMRVKNLNPSDCFYFDHKQENLDAAKQAGIEWLLYLNNDQIIPLLQQKFSS